MRTPPLLVGAALVFWGWQTGYLVIGILMAVALEGSRLTGRRIELSNKDLNRITDLCALVFGAMFVYRLVAGTDSAARWIPMAFFPLVAAQAYSTRQAIPLTALFWSFRKEKHPDPNRKIPEFSVTWPYFALCFMAASAANVRDPMFYAGLFVLAGWSLWHLRSRARSPVLWAAILLLAGGLGWTGQVYLHQFHQWVEKKGVDWFVLSGERDPYQNATAIGEIEDLKLSDRIEFRVRADLGGASFLLREAAYNIYRAGRWYASSPKFENVPPRGDGATWKLAAPSGAPESLTVFSPTIKGRGVLRLPLGSFRVDRLPVMKLEVNQYGAVKIDEGPGLVAYRSYYGPETGIDSPPEKWDWAVPEAEKEALGRVAAELSLDSYSDAEKLKVVENFFKGKFVYSLGGREKPAAGSPLADFLLRTRRGHCEYFATAGVLLLREAGIPARYAAGYMVHEYSRVQNAYLVRARHAHSWVLAFVDNEWRELDPTPPAWMTIETEAAPFWEPLYDLWSWAGFKLSEWRWSGESGLMRYFWWLVALLVVILGRRLFFRKRATHRAAAEEDRGPEAEVPGIDSGLYRIEKRLADMGFVRAESETLAGLARRVEEAGAAGIDLDGLDPILNLHYRLRFDPRGLSPEEREALETRVAAWLAGHEAGKAAALKRAPET